MAADKTTKKDPATINPKERNRLDRFAVQKAQRFAKALRVLLSGEQVRQSSQDPLAQERKATIHALDLWNTALDDQADYLAKEAGILT